MVVVPYYNKPTQDGLREHFVAVAASVKCPVVVYNIPGRTGDRPRRRHARAHLRGGAERRRHEGGDGQRAPRAGDRPPLGDRITVLSGDDALTLPMIAVGARGVISVTSNVYPAEVARATRLALDGKLDEARRAHLALCRVHEAMFVEANPARRRPRSRTSGKMTDVVRGPLVRIDRGGAREGRRRAQGVRGRPRMSDAPHRRPRRERAHGARRRAPRARGGHEGRAARSAPAMTAGTPASSRASARSARRSRRDASAHRDLAARRCSSTSRRPPRSPRPRPCARARASRS